ncbi:deleted in malignant brain tumors 1 protein-like [Stylophora pistillata]|uniref:deleted in malignant brain tumors 1 protein-like n=1 Tax=Stylophora pistillata TaxID=50429 RepID=UPI000C050C74|nr:deleted in malignant brain tumors 1 protein-like [Stylophora pistillata]
MKNANYFLSILLTITTGFLGKTSVEACGDRLTGASGTFSSPQYPLNYPINANCVWRINVTRGFAVNFTFIDFDTESCCDRLHIRNGDVLLDSYGGNLSNFTVGPIAAVSNNAEIEVSFTSDNSVRRKGFVAYYNIFALPAPSTPMPTTQGPTQSPFFGCGGMLNGTSGTFGTPGYSVQYKYDNNLDCAWTLLIPSDGNLTLTFVVFDTEQCCDFVRLTDGDGQTIASLSGLKQNYEVAVNGNTTPLVTVTFTSDSSVRLRGFLAQYHIDLPPPSSSVMSSSPMVPLTTSVTITSSLSSPILSEMNHRSTLSTKKTVSPAMSSPVLSVSSFSFYQSTPAVEISTLSTPAPSALSSFLNQSTPFTEISTLSSPILPMFSSSQNLSMSVTALPTLSSNAPSILSSASLESTLVTELPTLSSAPFTTVKPSSAALAPVTSSFVAPIVTLTPDVQTMLVNLLSSVSQIILRLQGLLQGPISSNDFASFQKETLVILKQIENLLTGPTTAPTSNRHIVKRDIREFPDTQELLELLNKVHQKLLG